MKRQNLCWSLSENQEKKRESVENIPIGQKTCTAYSDDEVVLKHRNKNIIKHKK